MLVKFGQCTRDFFNGIRLLIAHWIKLMLTVNVNLSNDRFWMVTLTDVI